ncbi:hypothetical protein Ssed_3006 [Shewanella sediminis HAW-EB3]|uniref:Uncharacterized protein n=1 Tax=Shewanella sediminis (strain HAW-EB3) TaxID=425104 RepID=A8FXN7_SHESH|nr:hypothetical protein [Shewanella sediminis]ABV37610.1 hypothetical protein Ssed_3006 [Shewanella sediminis HAW-EB3]
MPSEDWNLIRNLDEIADIPKKLLSLPPQTQVELNLTSMANFFPFLLPIIKSIMPTRISEIGADRGFTSKQLQDVVSDLGAELDIIDPALNQSDEVELPEHTSLFAEKSFDYFNRKRKAEICFLDGDHNYAVVKKELELLNQEQIGCKVIFAHDVGWPCGYRDMHYGDEYQDSKLNIVERAKLFPTTSNVSKVGYSMDYHIAEQEGGEQNGVLSAFEEFLAENDDWEYFSIPSVWGLGIMFKPDMLSQEQLDLLADTREKLDLLKPFLGVLELNRIHLLAKVDSLYGVTGKMAQDKAKADEEIKRLNKVLMGPTTLRGVVYGLKKIFRLNKL